jgi:hypothetical protein
MALALKASSLLQSIKDPNLKIVSHALVNSNLHQWKTFDIINRI